MKAALPTVVNVPSLRGNFGRSRSRPNVFIAHKAYDSRPLRELLMWLGIQLDIPHRGDSSRGLGKKRWPVEGMISFGSYFLPRGIKLLLEVAPGRGVHNGNFEAYSVELPESLVTIPEPSSLVLAVIGLLGFLFLARFRRSPHKARAS